MAPKRGSHNAQVDCANSLRAHKKREAFGSNRAAVVRGTNAGLTHIEHFGARFLYLSRLPIISRIRTQRRS